MNNKAYLRLLILPILVTSPLLYASDNPNLRFFIDSANRSLRSRQFDRAINDLIAGLRIAKRERASKETVSAILNNLGYSYRQVGRRSVRKIDRSVLDGRNVVRHSPTDRNVSPCSGCRSIPRSIVHQQSRQDCSEFKCNGAWDTRCPLGQRLE